MSRPISLAERVQAYQINQETGCWEYAGLRNLHGYGTFQYRGRTRTVHRAAYEVHFGPIPPGMCVCHKCDTPACINPAHLFLGTHRENMLDMCRKGRNMGGRGPNNHTAVLAEADVRAIRASTKTTRQLAADYGIDASQVRKIRA